MLKKFKDKKVFFAQIPHAFIQCNVTAEDSTTDVTDNNPTATITLTAEDSTADVEKDNDD